MRKIHILGMRGENRVWIARIELAEEIEFDPRSLDVSGYTEVTYIDSKKPSDIGEVIEAGKQARRRRSRRSAIEALEDEDGP